MQALEERFLFLTLLLRQPRLQMIYVTSMPVDETIIEYYLSLLAGVIPSHARRRLHLVSVRDRRVEPLTAKLLERPRIVEQIRALIPDPRLCHLVPYVATSLERDLAVALGIPMYAADPRLFPYGRRPDAGGSSAMRASLTRRGSRTFTQWATYVMRSRR